MPLSKTPKKNRVVISPPQFLTRPWQIITSPNMNMQSDTTSTGQLFVPRPPKQRRPSPNVHQTCGLSFLSRIFDGISHKTYGTKKIVSAVLYLVPSTISKSALSPKMAALLMLTLRTKQYQGECRKDEGDEGFDARCLPVQKGKQVQHTQARQDVPVDLGHQPALGGGRERRELRVWRLQRLRRIALAIVGGFQLYAME